MTKRFWKDEEVLNIMHLAENEGLPYKMIGERYGVAKNSIVGVINRIKKAISEVEDLCVKPEHMDGGMKPKWWKP